jgi:hypothetical protein
MLTNVAGLLLMKDVSIVSGVMVPPLAFVEQLLLRYVHLWLLQEDDADNVELQVVVIWDCIHNLFSDAEKRRSDVQNVTSRDFVYSRRYFVRYGHIENNNDCL